MSPEEVIRRMAEALDQAQIPYMLTGSFASSYHGTPRSSNDIDFVVAPTAEQLRALRQVFRESEYYFDLEDALEALRLKRQFNVIDLASGWKIDFIIRKTRPFSHAEFERRFRTEVAGTSIVFATAEDVILAKLEWAKLSDSERQIEDAAGILRVQGHSLDQEYIRHWVTDLHLETQWSEAVRLAGMTS